MFIQIQNPWLLIGALVVLAILAALAVRANVLGWLFILVPLAILAIIFLRPYSVSLPSGPNNNTGQGPVATAAAMATQSANTLATAQANINALQTQVAQKPAEVPVTPTTAPASAKPSASSSSKPNDTGNIPEGYTLADLGLNDKTGQPIFALGMGQIGWTGTGTAQVPSGACIDYDPRSGSITGNNDVLFKNDVTARAHMTSKGSITGVVFSVYWTPCLGGPLTSTTSPSAAPSAAASAAPSAAASMPNACSSLDPTSALGGKWEFKGGNMFTLVGGSATIHGANGWTVHTPGFPGGTGLPADKSETTTVASAYGMGCQQ